MKSRVDLVRDKKFQGSRVWLQGYIFCRHNDSRAGFVAATVCSRAPETCFRETCPWPRAAFSASRIGSKTPEKKANAPELHILQA